MERRIKLQRKMTMPPVAASGNKDGTAEGERFITE